MILFEFRTRRREQDVDVGVIYASPRSSWLSSSSHLTGRDELQRPESGLEVGSVALEIVESASNAGLQLRGVLAGRAVGRDLVELRSRHVGRWLSTWRDRLVGQDSHGLLTTFSFGSRALAVWKKLRTTDWRMR